MNENWRNELVTKGMAYDALANLDQYAEVGDCLSAIKGLPPEQPKSSNTISRQAAIEALFDWEMTYDWDEHCREEDPKPAYIVSPSDVIEQLPSAHPQWIPVSERLPDEWKRVLIQNDEGLFLVGFVKDRGWGKEWYYQYEMYDYDAYIESEQGKIVAWCELPDPWKGE